MKPFDRLTDYLIALERRLRWLALSRGVAVSAAAALILLAARMVYLGGQVSLTEAEKRVRKALSGGQSHPQEVILNWTGTLKQ